MQDVVRATRAFRARRSLPSSVLALAGCRAARHAACLRVCLWTCLLAAAAPVRAQDLVVSGCDQREAGEIGVGSLQGSIGQQIAVPVSLHAVTVVDAFTLDVDLPAAGLAFVRIEPGTLFSGWTFFGGHYIGSGNLVRIVAADNTQPIAAGSVGTVAFLVFEVTAAGAGEFGTSNLQDDLVGYVSCEDAHGTSAVEAASWGHVKAGYR